jgi:hypothetical protein
MTRIWIFVFKIYHLETSNQHRYINLSQVLLTKIFSFTYGVLKPFWHIRIWLQTSILPNLVLSVNFGRNVFIKSNPDLINLTPSTSCSSPTRCFTEFPSRTWQSSREPPSRVTNLTHLEHHKRGSEAPRGKRWAQGWILSPGGEILCSPLHSSKQ